MHLAHILLLESSFQFPSVFPELQKATRNINVTKLFYNSFFIPWGWRGRGAGLAEKQRGEAGGERGVGGRLSVL